MPVQRTVALLIAAITIVAATVLLIGAPVEAKRSPAITRSIGTIFVGMGGTFTVDASNFTGKAQTVTVTLKTPAGFTGASSSAASVPTADGRAFNFTCPSGVYCGALVIAKSSSKIALDAHWTYNSVEYFVRPGDWAKV